MTFYVENESEWSFPFSVSEVVNNLGNEILESEQCPYEVQVNVLLTDNEGIRGYNRQFREIDKETDVLSFPNLDYDTPGVFDIPSEREADYFDPDTGELILGDIVLSADKVKEQAAFYGHSEKRELAFLLAHSMLHLCGYDHMEEKEAQVMEEKQEACLLKLGITRE